MSSNNAGKVALATGAGAPAGISAAVARRFAKEGVAVGLLDTPIARRRALQLPSTSWHLRKQGTSPGRA